MTNKVTELKDKAVAKWEELKQKTSQKYSEIKESMGTIMQAAKDTVSEKLNNIKSAYEQHGGGIKGIAHAAMEAVKGYYTAGYDFINKLTGGKLGELVSTFKEKLESAKNIVKDAVEKLKAFFNFEWKLPNIKLPHFSITGSFSLNPPSIPKFSVSWYKKAYEQAMILNDPTIFGYSGASGQMLGGGEGNGNEVVVGETHLLNMIDKVVAKNVNDASANELTIALLKDIRDLLAAMASTGDLDTAHLIRALVDLLAKPMDKKLGQIQAAKARG